MKLTPRLLPLIAAIRAYATEHYNSSGWDVIVECYDDRSIAEVIGRARTVKGALAKFAPIIDVVADRQAAADSEIRAAVGEPEPAREKSVYDGSHTHHSEHGYTSTTRWHGKVGMEVWDDDGRVYYPGWRGLEILTPGYCNHRGTVPNSFWNCGGDHCNFAAHPECEPPF